MKTGGKLISSVAVASVIVTVKVLSIDTDKDVFSINRVTVYVSISASDSGAIDIVAY